MATTSLGRLTVDLMMKTGGIEQGTRAAKKRFKELNKEVEQLEKKIKVSMLAAGAAVAGFATATVAMAKKEMALIETQAQLAKSMNATVTGIRAVNAAADAKSLGNLDSDLARLHRRMGAVENGGGAAAKAIQTLGIDVKALGAADADEKLAMIADAIQKSGLSAQQATRYLQDLGFKQSGIYELFREGGDAIRASRSEVERLGLAVNAVEAEKIIQAQTAFKEIGDIVKGIQTQLAIELAPIMQAVVQLFTDANKEAGGLGNQVADGVNMAIDALAFVVDAVEGVKRTFEVAGKGIAVAMLSLKAILIEFANGIINGPVSAINLLIEQANKIPGIEIEYVGYGELGKAITQELELAKQAVSIGVDDIQETLLKPMPSETFKKFVQDARDASQQAAEAAVAARANQATQIEAIDTSAADKAAKLRQDALEKLRGQLVDELESLRTYGLMEDELLQEKYDRQKLLLDNALNNQMISKTEHDNALLVAQQQFNDSMAALDQQRYQQQMSGAKSFFGHISTLMNGESRKLFEIGKVAAIANATVSGIEATVDSYKFGAKLGGPALGATMASLAAVATGAQIAAIAKTKMGGGGGVSTTQAVSATAAPAETTQQQQRSEIYLRGISSSDIFTGEQLLEILNNETMRGGVLVGAGA